MEGKIRGGEKRGGREGERRGERGEGEGVVERRGRWGGRDIAM